MDDDVVLERFVWTRSHLGCAVLGTLSVPFEGLNFVFSSRFLGSSTETGLSCGFVLLFFPFGSAYDLVSFETSVCTNIFSTSYRSD